MKTTKPAHIIGIAGRAGTGKDTVATMIAEFLSSSPDYGYAGWIHAFADPLKDAAAAAFCIPIDDFYDSTKKEVINDSWGVSPRQIAQFLGTEVFRDSIHKLLPAFGKNFWAHRTHLLLTDKDEYIFSNQDIVIIPDVRFKEEVDYIHSQAGTIIYLTSDTLSTPLSAATSTHSSESLDLSDVPDIYQLKNNSTLEDLENEVIKITKDILHFVEHPHLNPFR